MQFPGRLVAIAGADIGDVAFALVTVSSRVDEFLEALVDSMIDAPSIHRFLQIGYVVLDHD